MSWIDQISGMSDEKLLEISREFSNREAMALAGSRWEALTEQEEARWDIITIELESRGWHMTR